MYNTIAIKARSNMLKASFSLQKAIIKYQIIHIIAALMAGTLNHTKNIKQITKAAISILLIQIGKKLSISHKKIIIILI